MQDFFHQQYFVQWHDHKKPLHQEMSTSLRHPYNCCRGHSNVPIICVCESVANTLGVYQQKNVGTAVWENHWKDIAQNWAVNKKHMVYRVYTAHPHRIHGTIVYLPIHLVDFCKSYGISKGMQQKKQLFRIPDTYQPLPRNSRMNILGSTNTSQNSPNTSGT